ncbi:hypothetical protein GCM10010862_38860 [Devosia nitrariae]|uniref:BON domain-containing protein n=1 Tax=Devosia nitrariae TaxID=2071872 RepID=A0ABQ5W955_9HYPH|nr:hypothetical protein GCM10010862_38860 [Devosia nitrariae]
MTDPVDIHGTTNSRRRSALREFNEPFVGNTCADDNVAECVQLALWTTPGLPRGNVHGEVKDRRVTLTGTLASRQQRQAAEAAVRALDCVTKITNDIAIDPTLKQPPEAVDAIDTPPDIRVACAFPMVYVTRYCSMIPASVSAAIADAITSLDHGLADWDDRHSARLVVLYRNQRGDTVTLDVGYLVERGMMPAVAGEVKAGSTPAGEALAIEDIENLPQLVAAREILLSYAAAIGRKPENIAWQILEGGTHSWPNAPLHLLLSRRLQ